MQDTNNKKTAQTEPEKSLIPVELLKNFPSAALEPLHHIEDNPAVAYLISLGSNRSRQTMVSCLNIVAQMTGYPNLKDCLWSAIRRHHIQAIVKQLGDAGKAPATINTYLAALKGVALEAWSMQQMDTDSFQHIKQVRSVKGSRLPKGRALTHSEIQRLFFICEKDANAKGSRDAAILGMLLGCGLRRSEIVALNMESLITQDHAVKVLGKGNKERIAYMPRGTWRRLDEWIEGFRGSHAGPLFTRIRRFDDVTHQRITDQAIYHILEARRIQAHTEKFAPHDLRRTFASAMLDNGEDIATIKDAMGHASIATTQKYDRRGNRRLKHASQHLNIAD